MVAMARANGIFNTTNIMIAAVVVCMCVWYLNPAPTHGTSNHVSSISPSNERLLAEVLISSHLN